MTKMNKIIFTPLLSEKGEQVVRAPQEGEYFLGWANVPTKAREDWAADETKPILIRTEVPLDPPATTGEQTGIGQRVSGWRMSQCGTTWFLCKGGMMVAAFLIEDGEQGVYLQDVLTVVNAHDKLVAVYEAAAKLEKDERNYPQHPLGADYAHLAACLAVASNALAAGEAT